MVRVLVAEDSAVTREYLMHILSQDPTLEVTGAARNGLEAVAQVERLRPDVVLMDIHMPGMDGYDATKRIMERAPTPIVMVSSVLSHDEIAMTFKALEAGALTVLNKPDGPGHPGSARASVHIRETVKLMASVKVVHRWPKRSPPAFPPLPPIRKTRSKARLIALGASTGGPTVMAEILADLPGSLPIPILAVQHIAPGFVSGLAEWLAHNTLLRVKLAEDGESTRAGTVYLAPSGSQMGISRDSRIRLTGGPAEQEFCPSISHLFQSVAESFGSSAIGVLLSGMGQDGAAGLMELDRTGGVTVAQDEDTCVIFGMPGEAVRLGAAQYVLPPRQISELLRSLIIE